MACRKTLWYPYTGPKEDFEIVPKSVQIGCCTYHLHPPPTLFCRQQSLVYDDDGGIDAGYGQDCGFGVGENEVKSHLYSDDDDAVWAHQVSHRHQD